MNNADLQNEINSLANGATFQILPGEHSGPVSIGQPVVIDGQGSTIWSMKGPVLTVESDGVILRNLKLEVTGEFSADATEKCALLIKSAKSPILENVEVKGSVVGFHEEEGEWIYPYSLSLGQLKPGLEQKTTIKITVPMACTIKSDMSGVNIEPKNLIQGTNDINVCIEALPEETLLDGSVFITSKFLKRRIKINAHIMRKSVPVAQTIKTNVQEPILPRPDLSATRAKPGPMPVKENIQPVATPRKKNSGPAVALAGFLVVALAVLIADQLDWIHIGIFSKTSGVSSMPNRQEPQMKDQLINVNVESVVTQADVRTTETRSGNLSSLPGNTLPDPHITLTPSASGVNATSVHADKSQDEHPRRTAVSKKTRAKKKMPITTNANSDNDADLNKNNLMDIDQKLTNKSR